MDWAWDLKGREQSRKTARLARAMGRNGIATEVRKMIREAGYVLGEETGVQF